MRPPIGSLALRLVILIALLLALGRLHGTSIVAPMLPALSWMIETVDDRLRVDHAFIVHGASDTIIQLQARPVRMFFLGDRVLMPESAVHFKPSTLLGSVLQPVIILLAIILAWPAARRWAYPARLLLALPMTLILLVVNVPLGFVGVMQDFRASLPAAPVTPLVYWNDFLQTGGPLALAIAAGILVVSAADRWVGRAMGHRQMQGAALLSGRTAP